MNSLPQKISNYIFGAVFMGLAWSLRGQFGHLKGALIPGAAAAAVVVLLHREELWRKAFGWAVLLSALGFSLGGHLSYGSLIQRILESHDIASQWADYLDLFLRGAVWGGLGMTFLGFSLQERVFTTSDLLLLALLGLFWFVPLGILNREALDMLLYGTGLLIMHLYNFFFKKSRMMAIFGASGILGFGLAFVAAVLILDLGKNGFLGSGWPWWHLRDQIIGMIGGCAVVWAFHRSVRSNLFPNPQVITLTTQKGGFLFFAVVIPAVETFSVFGYWAFERSMPFTWQGYVLGLFFFLFFVTLSAMLLRADESWLEERGLDYLLLTSVMFFIWYVSGVAILKELIPAGIKRWEPAYTFFILYACILSVILPAKIRRKV